MKSLITMSVLLVSFNASAAYTCRAAYTDGKSFNSDGIAYTQLGALTPNQETSIPGADRRVMLIVAGSSVEIALMDSSGVMGSAQAQTPTLTSPTLMELVVVKDKLFERVQILCN